ncbi:hypothetical protein ACSSVZ_005167 [Amorphus sp. MBR-141]
MASKTRLSQAAPSRGAVRLRGVRCPVEGWKVLLLPPLGEGWLHRFERLGGASEGDRKKYNRMAAVPRPTDPCFETPPAGDGAGTKVLGVFYAPHAECACAHRLREGALSGGARSRAGGRHAERPGVFRGAPMLRRSGPHPQRTTVRRPEAAPRSRRAKPARRERTEPPMRASAFGVSGPNQAAARGRRSNRRHIHGLRLMITMPTENRHQIAGISLGSLVSRLASSGPASAWKSTNRQAP